MLVEMDLLHELETHDLASIQYRLVQNEAARVQEVTGLQRKPLCLSLDILQLCYARGRRLIGHLAYVFWLRNALLRLLSSQPATLLRFR